MKHIIRVAILLSAFSVSGCSFFQISDEYGNTYGGLTDFGNQYAWQLSTCEADPGLVEALSSDRGRWMQCCMWRHGVSIDDPKGCDAPPYYKGIAG
ncbi:MAG TPA: hypothetical protein VG328_14670 [Stellaceae bacterium]|jgi:hypothetical protein|nr:hypothetical protein [Stellaceae bacterium]